MLCVMFLSQKMGIMMHTEGEGKEEGSQLMDLRYSQKQCNGLLYSCRRSLDLTTECFFL